MLLLLALFLILEHVHIFPMHYMQSSIDRTIPFTAQFVWAYLAWFPYIVFSFFWFSTKDHDEYVRMTKMILFGWAAFLIFSFFYPTMLSLRPGSVGSGISALACSIIYAVDSPSNVFPSMHVYVTLCFAITCMRRIRSGGYVPELYRIINPMLTILIPLSTLFVKQHSVADVAASCVMAAIMYVAVYLDPLRVNSTGFVRVLRKSK